MENLNSKPTCFKCANKLPFSPGTNVGRSETCNYCLSDVRVCYNSTHYDKMSYNECREPQADRVVEKDKRNFCDYFKLSSSGNNFKSAMEPKDDVLKKLNDLFK